VSSRFLHVYEILTTPAGTHRCLLKRRRHRKAWAICVGESGKEMEQPTKRSNVPRARDRTCAIVDADLTIAVVFQAVERQAAGSFAASDLLAECGP
jgi:hypothetical protein